MTKSLMVGLACVLLGLSAGSASAHRTHHTTTNPRDPNFNPLEFPLCFAWDPVKKRDVWVCGRSAY